MIKSCTSDLNHFSFEVRGRLFYLTFKRRKSTVGSLTSPLGLCQADLNAIQSEEGRRMMAAIALMRGDDHAM